MLFLCQSVAGIMESSVTSGGEKRARPTASNGISQHFFVYIYILTSLPILYLHFS